MTNFISVAVYDLNTGVFIGYAIKGEHKLQSTTLWWEGEEKPLEARLNELNHASDLQKYWPDPRDPNVQALLTDPDFHPVNITNVASNANVMERIRAACEHVAKQRAETLG